MIYIPEAQKYKCVVVQNEDVVRAYEQKPINNSNINYRDFFINSNYIFKDGTQSFGQYATLPVCLSSDDITNNFYYRNDLDSILIILLIMFFFCICIPLKIFSKLFKRGAL